MTDTHETPENSFQSSIRQTTANGGQTPPRISTIGSAEDDARRRAMIAGDIDEELRARLSLFLKIIPKSNAEEMKSSPPDLFVVDFESNGIRDVEIIRRLREAYPNMGILTLISRYSANKYSHQLRRADCKAYVFKTSSDELLQSAIDKISTGQSFFDPTPLA